MEKLLLIPLALAIFFLIYGITRWISSEGKTKVQNLAKKIVDTDITRNEDEIQAYKEEGRTDNHTFLAKIDSMLIYSRILKKTKLTTTTFILLNILAAVLALGIGISISGFLIGLVAALIVFFGFWIVVRIFQNKNYSIVENSLIEFINIIASQAQITNDLFTILSNASYSMPTVLKEELTDCCYMARVLKKPDEALIRLANNIEHEKFKEIISNLEITGRHTSDYRKTIEALRSSLLAYIGDKEEKKSIKAGYTIEFIVMTVMYIITLYVSSTLINNDLFDMVLNSVAGLFLIIYLVFVLIISVFYLIKPEHDS